MHRPLPELIDPLRLCSKGRVLQGSLTITRMSRLLDISVAPEEAGDKGDITIDFTFAVDQSGQENVSGSIDVVLWILCQRCLHPMRWNQNIAINLALVNSDLQVEKLSPQYEPLFLPDNGEDKLHSLADIVESEILLALPQEAMHNKDQCSIDERYRNKEDDKPTSASKDKSTKPSPFAVLKQIKSKED